MRERPGRHLEAKKGSSWHFTSKELDEETGLYYYGARYYEPATSRWMSPDPAGFGLINPMDSDGELRANYSVIEALNWYAYVSNNPVKYVDPTGMWEFKVGVGTGAALKFRIHTDDNGNIDADIATGVGVGFLLTFDPLSTSENIGPGMLTAELSASVDIEGAGMRAGVTLDSVVAIENSGKLEDRSSFTISVPPAPGVSVEYKYDVAAGEGTSKHSAATEWGVQGMIFMGVGEDLDEW